jgi:hypothetical protein
MSTQPSMPPAPGYPQPPTKSSALKWILVGVGGFFVVLVLCVFAAGFFVVHKAKQAGLDSDLIKRNPALAIAKMAVAANPNLETVSADEGRQEITVRDKQNGKVTTMSFEDAKRGKFVFKEDGQEAVTVTSGGPNGTVEMKSAEGTMKFGGNAKLPAWVPNYPGSDPQGAFSSQGQDVDTGTFTFKTKDASDKVVKYYQDQFQSSGLKITNNFSSQNNGVSTGMITAEDGSQQHTINVVVGQDNGQSAVSVTYALKK